MYQKLNPNKIRLQGGGKKLISAELEDYLVERISDYRFENRRVSRCIIEICGREFSENKQLQIKCSSGWLELFLDRNNLVVWKATIKPVQSDEVLASRAAEFYKQFTNIILEYNIEKEKYL